MKEEEEEIMESISTLVCAVTVGVIAFGFYTQSKKCKDDGKENEARLWMLVSIIVGAFAVVSLAALVA